MKARRHLRIVKAPDPVPWSVLGVLLVLAALAFSRAPFASYVSWDDNVLIQENQILRLAFLPALRACFTGFYHGDYIPLTLMSFWADLRLFGETAHGPHVVNLILHLANISLLFALLRKWEFSAPTLVFVTALFAFHPLQVESVAWISERKGLLATVFLFAALLASERAEDPRLAAPRRWLWIALYASAYLVAFLAKAVGVLLPAILVALDRFVHKKPWRETFTKHGVVLALGGAASVWRIKAYESSLPDLARVTFDSDRWLQWPFMVFSALGFYGRAFAWPVGLSIIYPPYGAGAEWGWYGILGFAMIGAVAWAWWKTRDAWVAFFAAWCLGFLLPVLQIVPRLNFVNDRYMYLPLIGFAGLLTRIKGFRDLSVARAKTWVWLAVPIVGLTYLRADVWSSNEKLWAQTVRAAPESGLAHNNLAQVYESQKNIEGAVAEYEACLNYGRRDGTDNLAFNNLGILYSSPEYPKYFNLDKAAAFLRKGIEASPRGDESFTLRFNLAGVYRQKGERARAIETLVGLKTLLLASTNHRYDFLLARTEASLRELGAP